jgi:hypothetical protein
LGVKPTVSEVRRDGQDQNDVQERWKEFITLGNRDWPLCQTVTEWRGNRDFGSETSVVMRKP